MSGTMFQAMLRGYTVEQLRATLPLVEAEGDAVMIADVKSEIARREPRKGFPATRKEDDNAPAKSHFATCPKAEDFRRKKGRGCRQPAQSATTQTSLL